MFSSVSLMIPESGLAGTRRRIVVIMVMTAGLALLIAGTTLFWHAYEERRAFANHGLSATATAVNAVERETAALGYLLKGLSRSPLLRSGDLEGFYHQLRSTPHPEGAWFALWDLERQILNTTRPFGTDLPTVDELPGVRQRLEEVRTVGLSLSDRIYAPLLDRRVVSVSLRLDDQAGNMNRVLSLMVPEEQLNKIVRDVVGPSGWTTILLDRKLRWLADGIRETEVKPTAELLQMVSGRAHNGKFETGHGWQANLVVFERSPQTGYTFVSTMPTAALNAPILTAFYRTSLASLVLISIGAASALALLSSVAPIDSLRFAATSTTAEPHTTDARLNAFIERVSDCYFTLDRSYRITSINAATLRWCGRPRCEIVGRSYLDLVGRHGECEMAVIQAVEHRKAYQGELPSPIRPDRHIDFRAYPSTEGASVYFSDVTDRHKAVRDRDLVQNSLDALPQRIAILDDRGRIIIANQAWRRFVEERGQHDRAHGVDARDLDIGATGKGTSREMDAVLAGHRPSFEALYRWPLSRPERWFVVRASRFGLGNETRILVSHEDVTELIASRATVSELSDRLLTLQDDERQRIASELHDSTTQYLVAIGLNLMKVERLLPQHDGQRLLGEIDHLLEEALKELRLFTYLLYPKVLDGTGFCETIQALSDGYSDRTGIPVRCRIDEEADELGFDLRRTFLRVAQEALSNVHRHAGASQVTVDLRCTPSEVILYIADDGHGMRPRHVGSRTGKPSFGVGIPGMRNRLHQFGGTLRIRSGARGTILRACVPRGATTVLEASAVAEIGA